MILIMIYEKDISLVSAAAFLEQLNKKLKQSIEKLVNEAGGRGLKKPAIPHFR
jgi:hypothetical protein